MFRYHGGILIVRVIERVSLLYKSVFSDQCGDLLEEIVLLIRFVG